MGAKRLIFGYTECNSDLSALWFIFNWLDRANGRMEFYYIALYAYEYFMCEVQWLEMGDDLEIFGATKKI